MRRCLIALTAAAARHPVAATALFALLRRRPTLVAHASASTVQLIVDQAPDDLAAAVDSALPRYSTELLWPAAALARRLYDTLPATAGPAHRAHRLDALAARLSALGRRHDALAVSTHVVEVYRRLAADATAFEPDLARGADQLRHPVVGAGPVPRRGDGHHRSHQRVPQAGGDQPHRVRT